MPTDFDCRSCGACCCNPKANQAAGYRDYVEIRKRDNLIHKPLLLERYAVRNPDGIWHLQLTEAEQRCAALKGRLRRSVRCEIYADRPSSCRQVQAGTEACRRARADLGMDP